VSNRPVAGVVALIPVAMCRVVVLLVVVNRVRVMLDDAKGLASDKPAKAKVGPVVTDRDEVATAMRVLRVKELARETAKVRAREPLRVAKVAAKAAVRAAKPAARIPVVRAVTTETVAIANNAPVAARAPRSPDATARRAPLS
jgi:hypothetical protein